MSTTKPKISACLIVKNEEECLARCLGSLKDYVDEIVVVDTGSTDDSVRIAQQYGAVTSLLEWTGDFAAARNASLQLATGDWILVVDADEELTPAAGNAILKAVKTKANAFELPIRSFTSAGETEVFLHHSVRLFRSSPEVKFEGRVHESVAASIKGKIQSLDAPITHYGYIPGEKTTAKRQERIAALEAEVRSNASDASGWFNLANVYFADARHPEALFAAKRCISKLDTSATFGELVYTIFVAASVIEGRLDQALTACDEASAKGLAGPLLGYEQTCLLLRVGRVEDALKAVENACQWDGKLVLGDESVVRYKRFLLRGRIRALTGDLEGALADLDRVESVAPGLADTALARAGALEIAGRHDEALSLYENWVDDSKSSAIARLGVARTCFALRRYEDSARHFKTIWAAQPGDFDAWMGWLSSCEALHRPDEVLEAYEAFAKVAEPTAEILVNWGRALEVRGEAEKAVNCFAEAIQRDPSNPNAYFNFGDLLYRCGRFADAAQMYESALRLNPAYADGWFVLGNALAQLGLNTGAASSYQQALTINPLHTGAHYNLEVVGSGSR